MTKRKTSSWRRTRQIIPDRFITQRDIMNEAKIDALLFDQLLRAGVIPPSPPPFRWSGMPIWYRSTLPEIAHKIAAEMERRRAAARGIFAANTSETRGSATSRNGLLERTAGEAAPG